MCERESDLVLKEEGFCSKTGGLGRRSARRLLLC
jgi:hypothetical protein